MAESLPLERLPKWEAIVVIRHFPLDKKGLFFSN
jgi:hypothetical protein